MLHVVTTGAYYPPVVTTWKILTTEASQLTAGPLCKGAKGLHSGCQKDSADALIFDKYVKWNCQR